jgi:UDP-glucose 4-epimerase
MKILLTGGAGYIGSHTYLELVKEGFTPILIDDLSNSDESVIGKLEELSGQKPIFFQGNFGDSNLLDKIFSEHKIDGIIHFAAFKAVGESVEKPLKYYRNNISNLVVLLEKILEKEITNFVFSSSCTVYGEPDSLPINENAPFKVASSPYGNTKQIGEEIIQETCLSSKKLKAISLRYFNPIGAHESAEIGELPKGIPANLVPFLTQSVAGIRGKLKVYGNDYSTPDGTAIRDYIHVVDLAKAHIFALKHLIQENNSFFYDYFNIGTGKGSSVLEVIEAFESATGLKVDYEIAPRRDGDIVSIYASTDKSEKILNWKTQYSLQEALRDSWNWEKKLRGI